MLNPLKLDVRGRIVYALVVVGIVCFGGVLRYSLNEASSSAVPPPDPKALRTEIVRLHAEASQFLLSRNLQIPMSSSLSAQGDLANPYNVETSAQFMEKYGQQVISLRSKMMAAKIWTEKMDKLYDDLSSPLESRTAAAKLLDEMETASSTLH